MNLRNKSELERIYQNSAIFWCRDAADWPAIDQLQVAAATQKSGVLLFAGELTTDEKTRCIEAVQLALPQARIEGISPIYGFDRVRFQRILSRDEVISHAEELMRAAREFARLADDLSRQLADKIGISATELSLCGQYLPPEKGIEQTGILNADWKYFFHGFECGFNHCQSGQHFDVIFGFRDEFGVLDAAFWLYFLQTTPRYSSLASWLVLGYADSKQMMDVLSEAKLLTEISDARGGGSWTRRGFIVAPT